MKKLYFTFLFTLCIAFGFSKNNTDDIITELGKVRHHVDAGEASFNLEDLKYHSKKALLAIKTVKVTLDIEKCKKTFEVSVKISDLLDSALISESPDSFLGNHDSRQRDPGQFQFGWEYWFAQFLWAG